MAGAAASNSTSRGHATLAALGCVCLTFDLRGHAETRFAVRNRHARAQPARRRRRLRRARRAPKRRHDAHGGGRQQLRWLPGRDPRRRMRPVKWLALRAPALYKDSDWELAEAASEGPPGPGGLPATAGASGGEPGAACVHGVHRRCPDRRIGARPHRAAPGARELPRSLRRRAIADPSRDRGRRSRIVRSPMAAVAIRRCSSAGFPRCFSARRSANRWPK